MSTRIDGLELNTRIGDESSGITNEIRSIKKIGIDYPRRLSEHKILSADGSIIDDIGRPAVRILVEGEFIGEDSTKGITTLRAKFKSGIPLELVSKLVMLSGIRKVVIQNLQIARLPELHNYYTYSMIIKEYNEPPQEEEKSTPQKAKLQTEIEDIRGQVLDADGNPAKQVKVKIKGPKGETEVTTDDDGYYELLDVEEGTYRITVDAEEFGGAESIVEIEKHDNT